jgi:hypothetical protein
VILAISLNERKRPASRQDLSATAYTRKDCDHNNGYEADDCTLALICPKRLTYYDHKPTTNITARNGSDNARNNKAQIRRRRSGQTIVPATSAQIASLNNKKFLVSSVMDCIEPRCALIRLPKFQMRMLTRKTRQTR